MGEKKRRFFANGVAEPDKQVSPDLKSFAASVMKIDPSGRLLCASMRRLRDEMDFAMARKAAGMSDDEVLAAHDRDSRAWLSQGPEKIIHEFDERMQTEAFGLRPGTKTQ